MEPQEAKEYLQDIAPHYHQNNRYEIHEDEGYVVGYTNKGEPFYFDLEDLDKVQKFCWHCNAGGYFLANAKRNHNGVHTIFLHRLVMNFPSMRLDIDHIDNDPSNNRKNNLRLLSHKDNSRKIRLSKNNSTGVTGVYFRKDTHKWEVKIMVDGKSLSFGCYIDKEEAILARLKAELKYFGADNSPNRPLLIHYHLI